MINEQVAIDTLGVEKFLATMSGSLNKSAGQELTSNMLFNSATSTQNTLTFEYKFRIKKADFDSEKVMNVQQEDLSRTCNDDSLKLLFSHYDVTLNKRYVDSESNLVFEVLASRQSCRRLWR